jgi:hypothetical protein
MITKSEVYKNLINIQKESGQGLSGIVKVGDASNLYSKYIDELIQEGLVKACHTGGSIGHYESNVFYMPTSGYNVWEDEGTDEYYSRHKGRYLQFVRLYLGLVNMESRGPLEPGLLTYLQDPDTMKDYSEWLSRNSEQLKIMTNLSNVYSGEDSEYLSSTDIEWIKGKDWFKKNKTISECLNDSKDRLAKDKEIYKISKELISLYKTNLSKYGTEFKNEELNIIELQKDIDFRNHINTWLQSQEQNQKIQSIL